MPMSEARARFRVGQPIHHKRFDYRGVIVDVDPVFCGSEKWYEVIATSRPPKDRPWYHVLVHGAPHRTYGRAEPGAGSVGQADPPSGARMVLR
jgi:heat shock protein HspQ